MSHSGVNLAAAFAKVLDDFGIEDKVSVLNHLARKRGTYNARQILSVTCDNASPNDAMIVALADLVNVFPGAANRTRCFDHILNLVVKVIIRQFDVLKANIDEALDGASQALVDLAGDIEAEGETMDKTDGSDEDNDREKSWVNPRDAMSKRDREDLDSAVHPVRLALAKVSSDSD